MTEHNWNAAGVCRRCAMPLARLEMGTSADACSGEPRIEVVHCCKHGFPVVQGCTICRRAVEGQWDINRCHSIDIGEVVDRARVALPSRCLACKKELTDEERWKNCEKAVSFIAPTIVAMGKVWYPPCEGVRITRYANDRYPGPRPCKHTARLNFRGVMLCQGHAKVRALAEALRIPVQQLEEQQHGKDKECGG